MSLYVLARPSGGGRHRRASRINRALLAAGVFYVGALAAFSAYASVVIR